MSPPPSKVEHVRREASRCKSYQEMGIWFSDGEYMVVFGCSQEKLVLIKEYVYLVSTKNFDDNDLRRSVEELMMIYGEMLKT